MESGNQAASRAEFHGHPGDERDPEDAARIVASTRLPAAALSPRDSRRPHSAFDWRGDRAIANAYVAFAESSLGRSQRDRVAEDLEGNLCEKRNLRSRVSSRRF